MMIDQQKRLLVRPLPKPDESFLGYLVRLTEANGYEQPGWILQEAGFKTPGSLFQKGGTYLLTHERIDFVRLSGILGLDVDVLERFAYQKSEGNLIAFDQPISQWMIRLSHARLCPACLREDTYIRRIWELSPVTVCLNHRAMLLDECPNCKIRIPWNRKKVYECDCGYDWRNAVTKQVDGSGLNVNENIYRLCGLTPKGSADAESGKNPLLQLGLESFLSVLFLIVSQFLGQTEIKGKQLAKNLQSSELHDHLCRAYDVFEEWPNRFFDFLDWLRIQEKNGSGEYLTGRRKDFGPFYDALYKILIGAEYTFLREGFEAYLVSRWDGGFVTTRRNSLIDYPLISQKYLSKLQAAKLLSVGPRCIDDYLARRLLNGMVRKIGKRTLYLIDATSVNALKLRMEQSLTLTDAARELRTQPPTLSYLVEHGCLQPVLNKSVDGNGHLLIHRDELDDLFQRIRGRIRPVADSSDEVTLQQAVRMVGTTGINLGAFIEHILNGEISPCREINDVGFSCFMFSRVEVAAFHKERYRLIRSHLLSIEEVAERIGIHRAAVTQMIRSGILMTQEMETNPSHGCFITERELDRFQQTYVLPAELARKFGTSPRYFTNTLISRGIVPVTGPVIDGGRQYLFRREQFEGHDLAAMLEDAKRIPENPANGMLSCR